MLEARCPFGVLGSTPSVGDKVVVASRDGGRHAHSKWVAPLGFSVRLRVLAGLGVRDGGRQVDLKSIAAMRLQVRLLLASTLLDHDQDGQHFSKFSVEI